MNGSVDAAPTNLADLLLDHPFADEQPLLHGSGRALTAGVARRSRRASPEPEPARWRRNYGRPEWTLVTAWACGWPMVPITSSP